MNENHPLNSLRKKALRIIINSHYMAHSEPIFKAARCLKITDIFSVAIWKMYFKLMNNKLPNCFSSYTCTPVLTVVNERFQIRNPVIHLPFINHKFAEQWLKYCLTKELAREGAAGFIVLL